MIHQPTHTHVSRRTHHSAIPVALAAPVAMLAALLTNYAAATPPRAASVCLETANGGQPTVAVAVHRPQPIRYTCPPSVVL